MVATQLCFIFIPNVWGRLIQFDEHIFQMGWFNHQLLKIPLPLQVHALGGQRSSFWMDKFGLIGDVKQRLSKELGRH